MYACVIWANGSPEEQNYYFILLFTLVQLNYPLNFDNYLSDRKKK